MKRMVIRQKEPTQRAYWLNTIVKLRGRVRGYHAITAKCDICYGRYALLDTCSKTHGQIDMSFCKYCVELFGITEGKTSYVEQFMMTRRGA